MVSACNIVVSLVLAVGMMDAQVIRSTTTFVDVTIAVSQKSGAATPITAADIQIRDNGKEQRIATFEKVSTERVASGGVYSNRAVDGKVNQVLSIILLDALNTSWSDQAYARNQVVSILNGLRPNEEVAILVLNNKLRVLHDFSADHASLSRKAAAFKGDHVALAAGDEPDTASVTYSEFFSTTALDAIIQQETIARKARVTLDALAAIGNGLKRLPGRKNLIWVSAGFPIQVNMTGPTAMAAMDRRVTFDAETKGAISALLAANIAVYPVDARGLSADLNKRPMVNIAIMQDLASQTGGVAYYNRNDIGAAVREALDDTREMYAATYAPQPFEEDGKFHRIQVRAVQKGVRIRHRRGYFAPNAGRDVHAESKQRFADALVSPIGIAQIGLTGELVPGQSPDKITILVKIEGSDLALVASEGRWQGEVTMAGVEVGDNGQVLLSSSQTSKFNLSQENYKKAIESGVKVLVEFERIPKATTFRMAVMNTLQGTIGSLSFPLQATR